MSQHVQGVLEDFVPGVVSPETPAAEALAFAFAERRLLVFEDGEGFRVPSLGELEGARLANGSRQFLGRLAGREVYSMNLPEEEPPSGMRLRGLRGLFAGLQEEHFWLAGRAVQIVAWDRDHRFCGRCATPTEVHTVERLRRCPSCGLSHWPRLAPAVIVLVERGEELLLARSPHFLPGMYSTLAGFVEPGESLEHTVVREVEEEVGVRVGNLRYFGSQPWPFPHSLMVGFRSTWLSGEIRLEPEEIEDAQWFPWDDLPRIPHRLSIARALIEAYLAERRG